MAKGLNRATLLGNVGKDPEVRATQGGTVVASFSLATADRVKRNGQWEDESQWHNCVAFGRTAEIVRDYIRKGSSLYLEGKIQTRSWDDRESGQKKYRTEIIVNELSMLGGGKRDGGQQRNAPEPGSYEDGPGSYGLGSYGSQQVTDDDIPF